MSDRNWEAELAKIDKQLASVSDEQLLASNKPVPPAKGGATRPVQTSAAAAPMRSTAGSETRPWTSWAKVIIAVAAAGGLMFWPWPARCGLPLVGFTSATGAVALLGMWSAVGTWRHRLGLAHVASVLVTAWGLVLGAREVLPRVGYAVPSLARPAQWSCEGLPPLIAPTIPGATPPANGVLPSANPTTLPSGSTPP